MLCSKLHRQKGLNLIASSFKMQGETAMLKYVGELWNGTQTDTLNINEMRLSEMFPEVPPPPPVKNLREKVLSKYAKICLLFEKGDNEMYPEVLLLPFQARKTCYQTSLKAFFLTEKAHVLSQSACTLFTHAIFMQISRQHPCLLIKE